MQSPVDNIIQAAKTEEIDYLLLINCLSNYSNPRNQITKLLKRGDLIRVKKGLYIIGERHRKRPISLEVLANLIYGPSYISYQYALSYYDLIPERVTRVTCACFKRRKLFKTPVGEFCYNYIAKARYPIGISQLQIDHATHFLIATPEKALADLLATLPPFPSKEDLLTYLVEGMRIDESDLAKLNSPLFLEISKIYKNRNTTLFSL